MRVKTHDGTPTGETIGARFAEERRVLRPVDVAFVAELATVASITPRGLARVHGAYYSVPCRWAGLDLIAWGGRDDPHRRRPGRAPDHAYSVARAPG